MQLMFGDYLARVYVLSFAGVVDAFRGLQYKPNYWTSTNSESFVGLQKSLYPPNKKGAKNAPFRFTSLCTAIL
jgi:hypothetical protein